SKGWFGDFRREPAGGSTRGLWGEEYEGMEPNTGDGLPHWGTHIHRKLPEFCIKPATAASLLQALGANWQSGSGRRTPIPPGRWREAQPQIFTEEPSVPAAEAFSPGKKIKNKPFYDLLLFAT
uniref:Uncharacterized protein n=1 Tax=Coturnix japonica TaxID=93934 RepID=A0A8C2TJX0_COTJA